MIILVEKLGGKPTKACGFAIGIERIILLLEKRSIQNSIQSDVYIVNLGNESRNKAFMIAELLRDNDYKVSVNLDSGSFKSQMKKADKSNAKIALIIGEDELKNNHIKVKLIRQDGSQTEIKENSLVDFLKKIFRKMKKNILKINKLSINTKVNNEIFLVDNISFSVEEGKTTCIVGESGSGKSLTALSIIRLLSPQLKMTGEILFNNNDICKMSDSEIRQKRGLDIAMIFQEPMTSLNPVLTIGYQIKEAIAVHSVLTKKRN